MKKRWLFWWISNIFWVVIFGASSAFVWLREVDGAGVTQTPVTKLVAIIVLLIAFIIPVIVQAVWLIINLVKVDKDKSKILQA